VKSNFKTTLGIAALYIIATGFTGAIFPGGGGGGGGGGTGGYGFSMVIHAPLDAIFRLLITTFFMLYLFTAYADKTENQVRWIIPNPICQSASTRNPSGSGSYQVSYTKPA
jgi:hypothetical protein